MGESFGAFDGKAIEALVAFFVLAPLADEEALGLKAAEEGVERAFVNFHSVLGECLAQGVAVLLGTQGGQDGENEGAAAEFETKVFESFGIHYCTVSSIVCNIHYAVHSISVKEKMEMVARR